MIRYDSTLRFRLCHTDGFETMRFACANGNACNVCPKSGKIEERNSLHFACMNGCKWTLNLTEQTKKTPHTWVHLFAVSNGLAECKSPGTKTSDVSHRDIAQLFRLFIFIVSKSLRNQKKTCGPSNHKSKKSLLIQIHHVQL